MIPCSKVTSDEQFNAMWVLTGTWNGKKHLLSKTTLAGGPEFVELHLCSIPNTTPLYESLEGANMALDTLKKTRSDGKAIYLAEPASNILRMGWTMNTNEESGKAIFVPIFFPKEMGVILLSKEDIRNATLQSVFVKMSKLKALEKAIEEAE